MSDDPALVPIGRGLARYQETMMLMMRLMAKKGVAEHMAAGLRRVFALGTMLDGFAKLEQVETVKIDPARMALPAKPMAVDEFEAQAKAFDEKFGVRPSPEN